MKDHMGEDFTLIGTVHCCKVEVCKEPRRTLFPINLQVLNRVEGTEDFSCNDCVMSVGDAKVLIANLQHAIRYVETAAT